MKVLTNLTASGGIDVASSGVDTIKLGSANTENNDVTVDNLTVWANAEFKNNVTLGSSATDNTLVNSKLTASNGLYVSGNLFLNGVSLSSNTGSGVSEQNISGALAIYAISSDVSSSFVDNTELTNSITNFPTRAEVTGSTNSALQSVAATYLTIIGASNTYATKAQVTGTLSSYATLAGVSGTFTTPTAITSAISNLPTRTEVTGALQNYATLSGLSSSFVQLSSSNTFTSNQIISGSVTANSFNLYATGSSYETLLLHFDGANNSTTFADSSANSKTVTPYGTVKISTAQSKFGGSSALFDGTSNSYLLINDTQNIGANDFTIEFWIYFTQLNRYQNIFDPRDTTTTGLFPIVYITDFNSIRFFVNGADRISSNNNIVSVNTWNHVAVSRTGTSTRLFVNGTQVGSTWMDTVNYIYDNNKIFIGSWKGINVVTGYIDEFRISRGISRYSSNFTVPTSAFETSFTSISSSIGLISDKVTVNTDFSSSANIYSNSSYSSNTYITNNSFISGSQTVSGNLNVNNVANFLSTLNVSGGIKFPATQIASADANTLDDYEEGTWTPALTGSTTTNFSYSERLGRYVKIGKTVFAHGYFLLNSTGSSAGTVRIGGLPFAASAEGIGTPLYYTCNTILYSNFNSSTITTTPIGNLMGGTSTVLIAKTAAGNNNSSVVVTDMSNTTQYFFSMSYLTS